GYGAIADSEGLWAAHQDYGAQLDDDIAQADAWQDDAMDWAEEPATEAPRQAPTGGGASPGPAYGAAGDAAATDTPTAGPAAAAGANEGPAQESAPIQGNDNSGPAATPATPTGQGTAPSGGGGGDVGGAPSPDMAGPIEANVDDSSSQAFLNSLASGTPSNLMAGMGQAGQTVPNIQEREKSDLADSLPEIDQPTGLETLEQHGQRQEAEAEALEAGQEPDIAEAPQDAPRQTPETTHEQPGPPPPVNSVRAPNISAPPPAAAAGEAQGEGGGQDDAWIEQASGQMRNAISQLPANDPNLNTSAGQRPRIDLTGGADPTQNQENKAEADQTMGEEGANAERAAAQDFGENDVFPDIETEPMSPGLEPGAAPGLSVGEIQMPEELPAEALAAFDQEAKAKMDEQLAPHLEEHQAALEEREAESERERESSDQEIEASIEEARAEQEAAQQEAQGEVAGYREEWRAENRRVREEYEQGAADERARVDGDIEGRIAETDTRVETELSQAETRAERERNRVEAQARREKAQARRQAEDRSWWQRVRDAVSSLPSCMGEVPSALPSAPIARRWVSVRTKSGAATVTLTPLSRSS
ncbi:MAG: hypothetical protein AAFX62_18320, partial [Pseudomonadota bacterium]